MNFIQIGFVFVLIGIVLLTLGALFSAKGKADVAFGGFIGPVPFGFATDPKLFWVLIALLVLSLIFLRVYRYL